MIVRDNSGRVVGQLEHLRDSQGNTLDTVTSYYNERPVVHSMAVGLTWIKLID